MVTECLQDQLRAGSSKQGMYHFTDQLLLGIFPTDIRAVNMNFAAIIPTDNAFFMHNLHQFQGGGIATVLVLTQYLMYLTYACLTFVPQYLQDGQFALSRLGSGAGFHIYDFIRSKLQSPCLSPNLNFVKPERAKKNPPSADFI
jgi:hypothetical protein